MAHYDVTAIGEDIQTPIEEAATADAVRRTYEEDNEESGLLD